MATKTFEKLSGQVESDETFVGGLARNMHRERRERVITGTGGTGKTAVMGLLERNGEVRTAVIPDTTRTTIQTTVRENVAEGSQLFTDAMPAYTGLARDYKHEWVDHVKEYVRGHVHTNGIENFWSLWKRCIKGTHVHISPQKMNMYLDEEMFRYNNRANHDASRFLLAANSVIGTRLTHRQLTGKIIEDIGK